MLLRKSIAALLSFMLVVEPVLAGIAPNIIRIGAPIGPMAENWEPADPFYSEWIAGTPYKCLAWTPSPSGFTESAEFEQAANDCLVDSSRNRQEREFETYSQTYRYVGEPTLEEITHSGQPAIRDYRIQYSAWSNDGLLYNCTNWTPDESTFPEGVGFTQTADDCLLDQVQARNEFSRFGNGAWADEGTQSFARTLTGQVATRTTQGSAAFPSIALNAPAGPVFINEPLSLAWTVNNAEQVLLSGNHSNSGLATGGQVVSGTRYAVTPIATGTFTYTAVAKNSANQQVDSERSVTVVDVPIINSFTVDKASVPAGGDVTLTWNAVHSDKLTIDNGVGEVSGASTLVNVGSQPGLRTYTLSASKTLNGIEKNDERSVQVEVVADPSLNIASSPTTDVFANAAFTLSWAGSDVDSYAIRGNTAASGVATTSTDLGNATSLVITPTAPGNYTYTLTGTNSVGEAKSITQAVNVVVNPAITSFTSSSSLVTAGGNITLSWAATGSGSLSIDQGVGAVTGTSKEVAVGSTAGSKTYTLTTSKILNGVTRTASQNVAVEVVAAPTVTISASPSSSVFANAAFNLSWTATGATNYKIRGNTAASGIATSDVDIGMATSRAITPTAAGTYTYTVTATNAAGQLVTATRSVIVVADPVVSAFTATPATVTAGGNTTLAWTTTGSTLSIDQSVGAVTGNSLSVAVGTTAGNKTYTLTASTTLNGVTRSATRAVTVSVIAAPTVTIGTAPATNVFVGEPFTLGWTGAATSYAIKGSAAASGVTTTDVAKGTATSHAITPTAAGTYTYTVTGTNAAGTTTTATRSVTVVALPTVTALTASPTTVAVGANTTLSWTAANASSLSIDQSVGAVTGTSQVVAVGTTAGSKTYTLTASTTLNGVTKTATRSVAVTVVAAPTVSINTAPSTNVFANAAFTLGWTGTNATSYSIKGNVAASGVAITDVAKGATTTHSITPTAAGTYTYAITATNAAGVSVSTTRSVTVVADPVVSDFTAIPTTVTAGGNTTLAWTTTGSTLSIDQSVGAVTGSSKLVAVGTATGNKTYTLTASTTLNGVTRSATRAVTVSVIAAPTVTIGTAPATNVFVGEPFTLGWTGTGATSYAIKGNIAASGVAITDVAKATATTHSITPTAAGTYTYTVTATNAEGVSTTTTRSVTAVALPAVTALTASPTSVAAGGSTTLSWTATGASSLSIDQSVGAVTGTSKAVAVGTTAGAKTYTLTASTTLNGVTKTAARSVAVTVVAVPTVSISTAPSTSVFVNAPFTLGWTGTGVTSYAIKGNIAASGVAITDVVKATATTHSITPTAAGTYTYTVTATNAVGVSTTTTRSVTVVALPAVTALTASPTSVATGGSTTLSWTTTGATALSIDQSVGAVTGTSKAVAVGTTAGNKTYTLTASTTLNGLTKTASRAVTVSVVAAPTVSVNSAPSTNVFVSAPFTLGWTGTNVTSYTIKGNVAASGVSTTEVAKGTTASHSITPTAAGTYTYTITATNSLGVKATATRSVTVVALPAVTVFTASPTSVTAGGTTTLSWTTTGATSLSIDQGVGAVTGTSKSVAVGTAAGSKTYTLAASATLNGVTKTATRNVAVTVVAAPQFIYDSNNQVYCDGNGMGGGWTVVEYIYAGKSVVTYNVPAENVCPKPGETRSAGGYTYTVGPAQKNSTWSIKRN